MTVIVKQYAAAQVVIGDYAGHAGVDREGLPWRVSFVGRRNALGANVGDLGVVDDTRVRILSIEASAIVKGMVVLTVEPVS